MILELLFFFLGVIIGLMTARAIYNYRDGGSEQLYKVEYVVPFEGAYYTKVARSRKEAEDYIDENEDVNDYELGKWEITKLENV